MIGSRLFYVIVNFNQFRSDPVDIIKIWQGGLVFYGAFLFACPVVIYIIHKKHLPFWKTVDISAPSIAIGHAFGRLGCLFAGCCYGKACDLPWAMTFAHPQTLAPIGIPLHPTQIYAAICNLTIFIILMAIRSRMRFDGQLFLIYVMLYGIARSVIEIFRGDDRGGMILGMFSVAQVIGLSITIMSLMLMMYLRQRYDKANNFS